MAEFSSSATEGSCSVLLLSKDSAVTKTGIVLLK